MTESERKAAIREALLELDALIAGFLVDCRNKGFTLTETANHLAEIARGLPASTARKRVYERLNELTTSSRH